jgi:hypothetical protein
MARAAAGKYRLAGPRDATLIALHMFLLGSGFDRDPQFPWVAESLMGAAPDRAVRLFRASLEFLNCVLK